ncbi:MAG: hypothetical protein ACYDFV_01820 [Vulcanimicrobiaceae bacterium]
MINSGIVRPIRSVYTQLTISRAACPRHIDVSNGKVAYCSIDVNGEKLRVSVSSAGAPQKFVVAKGARFYSMKLLERFDAASLTRSLGVNVRVACGEPRYRFLVGGKVVTCAIHNVPHLKTVRFKTLANGLVFFFNPKGVTSPKWMLDALAAHRSGRTTILDGRILAAWISRIFHDSVPIQIAATLPAFTVSCPRRVNLSGTRHGLCIESVGELKRRLGVWINRATGLHERPIDAIIDRPKVQRMAQADLNRRLNKAGLIADAVVQCAPGLMVVTPPMYFYCRASADGKKYRLEVHVEDFNGTVQWRAIPIKKYGETVYRSS